MEKEKESGEFTIKVDLSFEVSVSTLKSFGEIDLYNLIIMRSDVSSCLLNEIRKGKVIEKMNEMNSHNETYHFKRVNGGIKKISTEI